MLTAMPGNNLNMRCDVEEGEFVGWHIKFVLRFFKTKPHAVEITAHKSGKISITDLHEISQMLPVDVWPQFALDAFRQKGRKEPQQERLIP